MRPRHLHLPPSQQPCRRWYRWGLGLVGCLVLGGCGLEEGPAAPGRVRPRVGYVFVAQLMSEHPLYGQLQRLEQEAMALRRPGSAPVTATPSWSPLAPLVFAALDGPSLPLQQFAQRRTDWDLGPSLLPPPATSYLAPDLLAELNWTRRRLNRETQQLLAESRSREELALSRQRAQAIRDRQEQYNNAALDLGLSDDEAQAAAAERRLALQEEVELLMAAERVAAEERLRQFRQRQEQRAAEELQGAQREVWARQQERSQVSVRSGSEIRSGMSKAMEPPEPLYFDGPLLWDSGLSADITERRGKVRGAGLLAARRDSQARRMLREREMLSRRLYQSTRAAVSGVAAMQGWVVTYPPLQPREGEDLTESIRPLLRALYANP
ncbi:MAG: hypothetical protein HPY69_18160 [Armatimonadetes bacterium]|nr:hypothetical protein [Armatimonadota bacterium]